METTLKFFAVALMILIVFKAVYRDQFSWRAFGIICVATFAVAAAGTSLGSWMETSDVEIVNGKVFNKTSQQVNCEHSYTCNCVESCSTNSDGSRSCTQICQTCYDHSFDVDWDLHTTVGTININRVDRQGLSEPGRWTIAKIDDPVARQHQYVNYLRAAKGSLYHDSAKVEVSLPVPPYPSNVYDYHYLGRALAVGVGAIDTAAWNVAIANSLRDLGPAQQVNFVVVFAGTSDSKFASAVEQAWLGGKKNDVILVLGVPHFPAIDWVRVISWTDREDFKVLLRDAVMDIGKVTERDKIMEKLVFHTWKHYERKQMKDFEYLRSEIELPSWYIAVVLALIILVSVVGSLFAVGKLERLQFGRSRRLYKGFGRSY